MRETILAAGQRLALAADYAVLERVKSHRTLARVLNVASRVLVVVVGLALAYVVVTDRISVVAAGIFAVVLLFVPDLFRRVDAFMTAVRNRAVAGLVVAEAFFEHAGALLQALSREEQLFRYFALLVTGEVSFGRLRVRLVGEADGSARLLTVAA
ncbi:hypothetical protein [Sinomonas susongensis]|uniref:hypothetical protein n=1 Tax=Sinomonas susongensis TaxID=1324851 RepID=UPI001108978E|nr:hypothetical protein [Sinomonas susongensis]